jgi:hypothetical protein
MAKRKDDDQFLGGGLKFNSVGVGSRPEEISADTGDSGPYKISARSIGIFLIAVVLAVVLYFVATKGFGGVETVHGSAHSQPTDTGAPPSNF